SISFCFHTSLSNHGDVKEQFIIDVKNKISGHPVQRSVPNRLVHFPFVGIDITPEKKLGGLLLDKAERRKEVSTRHRIDIELRGKPRRIVEGIHIVVPVLQGGKGEPSVQRDLVTDPCV